MSFHPIGCPRQQHLAVSDGDPSQPRASITSIPLDIDTIGNTPIDIFIYQPIVAMAIVSY